MKSAAERMELLVVEGVRAARDSIRSRIPVTEDAFQVVNPVFRQLNTVLVGVETDVAMEALFLLLHRLALECTEAPPEQSRN